MEKLKDSLLLVMMVDKMPKEVGLTLLNDTTKMKIYRESLNIVQDAGIENVVNAVLKDVLSKGGYIEDEGK